MPEFAFGGSNLKRPSSLGLVMEVACEWDFLFHEYGLHLLNW